MDGWMEGGWMDGYIDGEWVDGWIDGRINNCRKGKVWCKICPPGVSYRWLCLRFKCQ